MLEAEIIRNLELISAVLRGSLSGKANDEGLSHTQASIILLVHNGETSASRIAGKLGVTKATISDSVKNLRLKNLVIFSQNKRDERVKILELTEAGKKLAGKFANYSNKLQEKMAAMHMSEKSILFDELNKLVQLIKFTKIY